MTHATTTTAGGQLYFSDAEWAAMQADDRHAAGVVVGLMVGIFSIGLVLYAIVDLIVW